MELTKRQLMIIDIVEKNQPITGESIANKLDLSRATIRNDLSILTMLEILGARPKLGYFYKNKQSFNRFSDKVKSIPVKEVMSMPVVLDEESFIYDALVTIFLEDVGSIFITRGGILTGVVSRKDLLRSTMGKMNLETTPISLIMTRMPNLITVFGDNSIYDAALKICQHNIDALAVVEKSSKNSDDFIVIGRFTKTNIARIFIDLAT